MRSARVAFVCLVCSIGCGDDHLAATVDAGPGAPVVPDGAVAQSGPSPILFVTQVPWDGFATISMPFGNHGAQPDAIPRGGDLMIVYPDGTLRNLTREAGFGNSGAQAANAIAVRDPTVHWDGDRAVFAMVIGSPGQYVYTQYHWQLYEVSGLERGATAVITRVANQPDYNNVSPCYASDDRILFTSDRPRDPSGAAQLYPQRDEYESAASVSGIWALTPATGKLELLEHAPSGVFNLSVDSAGRVIFTKWDHLQRDQQADTDEAIATFSPLDFADETAAAATTRAIADVFPEPRTDLTSTPYGMVAGHRFNQFVPWELNQDGTAEETINHVGRHELGGTYVDGSFMADPNLTYTTPDADHANRDHSIGDGGMFCLREDPRRAGVFVGAILREFAGGRAGQLFELTAGPNVNPEDMVLTFLTPTATHDDFDDTPAPAEASGHYRDPVWLSDGTLIAAHTPDTTSDPRGADGGFPYAFRLRVMSLEGAYYLPGPTVLAAPITASVTWWSPDEARSFDGALWELQPVEVAARPRPAPRVTPLPAPELQAFADEGVDVATFQRWLADRDLAVLVSRDVTLRDRADFQQPFNLQVPGGASSISGDGPVYPVAYLQIFQGDQVRGYGALDAPNPGRRVLARPMHDAPQNPPSAGPTGSVVVGLDGSVAAFVPARRALTWQLTDGAGVPIVRERNWLSVQPGEIRSCPACHGINKEGHGGEPTPLNEPAALRQLLRLYKTM